MKKAKNPMQLENDTQAYRGHLIVKNRILDQYFVTRDGFHICHASSWAHAKAQIDGLLD